MALSADLTGGMLLACGEWKPEMLLNILNAQDILTTKRNLAPTVSSVEADHPCSRPDHAIEVEGVSCTPRVPSHQPSPDVGIQEELSED